MKSVGSVGSNTLLVAEHLQSATVWPVLAGLTSSQRSSTRGSSLTLVPTNSSGTHCSSVRNASVACGIANCSLKWGSTNCSQDSTQSELMIEQHKRQHGDMCSVSLMAVIE